MIGTRGVPAAYGGFETAVEEIGRRLVDRGHDIVVYCRRGPLAVTDDYLGMRLVHLPALRMKTAETLSHTGLSALHVIAHRKPDAAFVFNAANAPFLPLLRSRRIPVALHMDGLEWKRDKWSGAGRQFYRRAEALGVRWSDALIADANGISDYYRDEFGAPTELLSYGAPIIESVGIAKLRELDLEPDSFHLVVARFEPENHVDMIVKGYARSDARLQLVVVGSAPYAAEHSARIAALAEADPRVRLLGGVWDQGLLDQLYFHARSYLHGHSVGGTNPSLLRALGAGTPVIAYDVAFNREVAGSSGRYFSDHSAVGRDLMEFDGSAATAHQVGAALRDAMRDRYDWDRVADGYERLAERLASGVTIHGRGLGARRSAPEREAITA